NALFGAQFLDVDPVDGPGAGQGAGHQLLPLRREDTCQPAVEFLWPAGQDSQDEPAMKPTAHQRRMIEARGLARRLRERLDAGWFWLATTVEDGGLTAGIHRLGEITQLSPRDRQRTARALDLLSRWRAAKDRVPMAHLVAQALDQSGFEGALVCEFLGERKLA